MQNSASELVKDNFSFILRRKTQKVMSKLAYRFGWRKYDPKQFKIEHIQVVIPQLPACFRDYRIAHITDIHYGQWISSSRLEGVVDLINKNNPNLIAVTGDFVSYLLDDSIEEMSIYLRKLKPRDLTVAVLGDHDYWVGAEKVRRIMKESNIYDISNNVYTVSKNASMLNIAGVDSARIKKDRLDLVLEKMPSQGPAILLVHEPDFAVKTASYKKVQPATIRSFSWRTIYHTKIRNANPRSLFYEISSRLV